ncbi:MAG TPA: four helix bundle protein [Parafilimonas sp.]|nr:four helix bundle protein [Parafilimonas sp.]
MPIKSFQDVEVYQLSHAFAMKIFFITNTFPHEERYSLTDQIRRSSGSVAVNIAEGWGKRIYINNFKKQLVDANGSLGESKSWLLFSKDCSYITNTQQDELFKEAETIGSKIWRLHERWQ